MWEKEKMLFSQCFLAIPKTNFNFSVIFIYFVVRESTLSSCNMLTHQGAFKVTFVGCVDQNLLTARLRICHFYQYDICIDTKWSMIDIPYNI